jgi:hypothetical protein
MLAARALGRLAGVLQGNLASVPCEGARAALAALLTPALAAQLANPDPRPLLVHLNSSLLNPQVSTLLQQTTLLCALVPLPCQFLPSEVLLSAVRSRLQVVWNSKMREEVLAKMEAVRSDPKEAGIPGDFQFEALKAGLTYPRIACFFCGLHGSQHCCQSAAPVP